jgi:hypothetical protein
VTSLSRRGLPSPEKSTDNYNQVAIDYRMGDAGKIESISNVLAEGGYVGKIRVCTVARSSFLSHEESNIIVFLTLLSFSHYLTLLSAF